MINLQNGALAPNQKAISLYRGGRFTPPAPDRPNPHSISVTTNIHM